MINNNVICKAFLNVLLYCFISGCGSINMQNNTPNNMAPPPIIPPDYILKGHTDQIMSLAFTPDEKILASGSHDHSIKIWDLSTYNLIKTLKAHTSTVMCVDFSPDGRWLASGSFDYAVLIWDWKKGEQIHDMHFNGQVISATKFSPDGKYLAIGLTDSIQIWNTIKWKQVCILPGIAQVRALAWSPDGKWLATVNGFEAIELWNTSTWVNQYHLRGHSDPINTLAYSHDGKRLLSGACDNLAIVWDCTSYKPIFQLNDHWAAVYGVAFSRNDDTIVTAGDYSLKLWNTNTGQLIKTLSGESGVLNTLVFSPSGKLLATGGSGNQINLWKWPIKK